MKKNVKFGLIFGLGILALFVFFYFTGVLGGVVKQSVYGSDVQKIAIPHFASFKCDVTQDKVGLAYNVPINGGLISKNSIGFYTNSITNIQLSFTTAYWRTDWGTRVRYSVCDVNGNNCGTETIISDFTSGTKTLSVNSIDVTKYSLKVIYERLPVYIIGGWKPADGLKVSYDSKAFGLKLYSTTRDPAGSTVCSSSCDLTCPTQAVRDKLVYTTLDSLDFYATAPYLEYWETIDYDLNSQGGATIYDGATFCLAGNIYTAKTLTLESGVTYVYPDTATRVTKQCCKGAVISTTLEDKICQSDYTWKTIAKGTRVACMSDINCPNAGLATCQSKISAGWHCSGVDSQGKFCVKDSGKAVACCNNNDCASDMICQNNKCVGGNVDVPILPNNGNNSNGGVQCEDKFGGLVPSSATSTEKCGFLSACWFGIGKPKVISGCSYDWTLLLILLGVLILLIIGLVIFLKYFNKPKQRGRK